MQKKILITGARGFIGSAFFNFLKNSSQHELLGISRRKEDETKQIYFCDLLHTQKLRGILSATRPDIIFHLAGGRVADFQKLMELNVSTTRSLFEAAASIKDYSPRVMIPATAAEYGPIDKKVKLAAEDYPVKPNSNYGFSKSAQTSLALMYARKGFDIIVARMFNISGFGVPDSLAVGRFAKEIAAIERGQQKAVIETKSLNGKRDFLDIADVCRALMLLGLKGRSGEIYNICSQRASVIRDLLKQLIKLSTVKAIEVKEEKSSFSESFDVIGSNRKLCRAVSFKPQVAVKQSLQESLNYYRTLNAAYAGAAV